MKKAYLILQNGKVFEGYKIGADISATGELVFTTGVVGYLETLTDPSYAGQIVVQTFPMIGNYGVIPSDFESINGKSAVKGYIMRELCDGPSNFRSEGALDEFLKKNNIPGICGVDTREITKIIRENGVMNAKISDSIPDDLSEISNYTVSGVVNEVSVKSPVFFPADTDGGKKYSVTLIDYGAKMNIIRSLCNRGCDVTLVSASTTAEEILASDPDGVMLSNGPGDPSENTFCIEQIKKLIGNLPIFGICLGHQLTALAMGGITQKLKYGHRGGNQPVFDVKSGRTYITSQNHGYAVISESLEGVGKEIFRNANDGSCEGMEYDEKKCFTVQFHPEACSGPHDTSFLFDRFIEMMEKEKN